MNSLKPGSDDEPVVKSSDDEPVVKKKSNTRYLKMALGLAAVILIPTIGSTLAATIAIGTSDEVEFGQGVATTVSCQSTAINIQPTVRLSAGSFVLDTIVVSDIQIECTGNFFMFRVLDSSDNPVEISSDNALGCKIEFIIEDGIPKSDGTDYCILSTVTNNGFTITPSIRNVLASSVASVTVETSEI